MGRAWGPGRLLPRDGKAAPESRLNSPLPFPKPLVHGAPPGPWGDGAGPALGPAQGAARGPGPPLPREDGETAGTPVTGERSCWGPREGASGGADAAVARCVRAPRDAATGHVGPPGPPADLPRARQAARGRWQRAEVLPPRCPACRPLNSGSRPGDSGSPETLQLPGGGPVAPGLGGDQRGGTRRSGFSVP